MSRYAEIMDRLRRRLLRRVLRRCHGNIARAARAFKMSRSDLHYLLKHHGIRADDYRGR